MLSTFGATLTRIVSRQNGLPGGLPVPLIGCANAEIMQTRGRKRGQRQLSKAEKLKKKEAREAKLAKELTFEKRMELRRIKKAKNLVEWPPRYDAAAESAIKPSQFNVCYNTEMRTPFYSFAEALEKHRYLATLHGNIDALVKLRLELNMTTEKATKFVGESRQIVSIPHPFKHNEIRTILAFVPNREIEEEALQAGADLALSYDSIKKILKGKFMIDNFDFCVAHEEMAREIMPLRGMLKTRFPTRLNGAIGPNVGELLNNFMNGINVVVKPNMIMPQYGSCDLHIGRLNMPNEHLEENIKTVLPFIFQQRNPALGSFINRAALLVPPAQSFFSIIVSQWEPVATEADMKKVDNWRKKKKELKAKKSEDAKSLPEHEAIIHKWSQDPLLNVM